MQNIEEISISAIQEMFRCNKISIKELVQEYLARIELVDQGGAKLNSILEINPDALAIAEHLDANRSGYTSNLYGVPILLKDNIDTRDRMHTSAGSLALADSYASADADIVKALRQKGVVILGKTNMTEFANHMTKGMPPGYSSRGGYVKSPYGVDKDPSGSSTGSAVAVSANLCTASIGTDTSGSIVSPAIANSIVGFRPSMGAMSQKGLIPVSFTMDTAGPMARTVMDIALLFSEITNTPIVMDNVDIKDCVIGIDEASFENVTNEESKKIATIIKELEASGARLKRIKIPHIPTEHLKQIQLHEFKYAMNQYLSKLPKGFKIRSLEDIIAFNHFNADKTLKYGQSLLIDAQQNTKGDLSEIVYKQLLQHREQTKKQVLQQLSEMDVCILFNYNLILQYVGVPIITVPRGLYNDGMPNGIYITAINDINLLKYAYQIEKRIAHRVKPR